MKAHFYAMVGRSHSRIIAKLASVGIASALLVGVPVAAHADEPSEDSSVSRSETALELRGYDEKVAEANGYKIVTDDSGEQQSIPVSPDAIAFEQELAAKASASRTQVYGNCGSSFIGVSRNGNHIFVGTGYSVFRPVVARLWTVQIYGFGGVPAFTWTGGSGSQWNSAAAFFYTGGGLAQVTPGSSVVLDNGAVCWSGAPAESF